MSARSRIRDPGYSAEIAGLDFNAIDKLQIRRLTVDSREVRRGDTFVAYPGESVDGRRYIASAIANGARSVLWEKRAFKWQPEWRTPNLGLSRLRARAGLIASHVYGHPSARLWMVGVTGTNGKTTCSQWIARGMQAQGKRCAVIGTLGYGRPGRLKPLMNTTPDAVWLHSKLSELTRQGVQAVSMEVSSIGLDQDRVTGVQFDVALFTNLTRDHLDYHRTMRRYARAKSRLFEFDSLKYAVLNIDDRYGTTLAQRIKRRGLRVIRYGFGPVAAHRGLRVIGSALVADAQGVRFDVSTSWGNAHVVSPVLGSYNAANLLATLAVLLAGGMSLRKAVTTLQSLRPIAGRMQTLGGGHRPLVVVDYAHTPDALEKVLTTLRPITGSASRLVCVFGCGGDRDRGKRPMMGGIATRLADRVVLTNDNPRSESPLRIVDDIVSGMDGDGEVELDRARAINRAISASRRGDIVLIAGKGHELYQEIGGARHSFNDLEVARQALRRYAA